MFSIEMVPIIILAFVCELVDSSLGMGYGTTLTPIMLALGFEPIEIVPAVLCSEAITGLLAGVFHHGFGNVDLRRGSPDLKIAMVMGGFSVVGVVLATIIAINVPSWAIKVYIGVLVLALGLVILLNKKKNYAFSWKRIAGLGALAAFNKGISGGGYGPVVTAGQVLSGVKGRKAVGITSLAEGVTSIVGFGIYLYSGVTLNSTLMISLILGAVMSVPISAYIVSRLPAGKLTYIIGGLSTALGGYTLVRLFL
ncbi:MAG: sulfite exporter TauE/SafE family protein [Anaerolineales bacterium]|nr:sulfite exporter TauE/SafE family protein [Anaerolineales bacterium]